MRTLFLSLIVFSFVNLEGKVYSQPSPQFKPKVEVSAVFIEHEGQILLLHRQNHKAHSSKWAIPGGKVDKRETSLQAAIREIAEETGYDIANQPIQDLGAVYVEHNEQDHFVYHMFRTTLCDEAGAVKISFTEHKGFTWVTPQEALSMDLMQDEDPCIRLVYGL